MAALNHLLETQRPFRQSEKIIPKELFNFAIIYSRLISQTNFHLFAEGSPGCNPPDIRLTKPRQRSSMTTTSAPILTFETTQIYLPDDFTTGDLEFINHNKDAIRAAFRNGNTGELLVDDIGVEDDLSLHYVNYSPYTWNDEKKNFEHSKSPSKRTRREAISFPSSSILKLRRDSHGVLTISEGSAAGRGRRLRRRSLAKSDYEMERIYIQSTDLVSSLQQSPNGADSAPAAHPSSDREANSDYDDNQIKATNRTNDANGEGPQTGNGTVSSDSRLPMQNASARPLIVQHPEATASLSNREHGVEQAEEEARTNSGLDGPSNNGTFSKGSELRRVKRKSGKTTGALSRPKSDSGSSSSKTTSRKTQCKFGALFPLPYLSRTELLHKFGVCVPEGSVLVRVVAESLAIISASLSLSIH